MRERLKNKISSGLDCKDLLVIDESDQHQGHAGHKPGGETHFRIRVVSEEFTGKTRMQRHRMIYGLVKEEMATQVHALSIVALTPKESL